MLKLSFLFIAGVFFISCSNHTTEVVTSGAKPDFSDQLTPQEISGKRMTPEILWKFARIGGFIVSPDNRTVVLTLTRYDYKTNKSNSNLFTIPVDGGKMEALTSLKGHAFHPRWKPAGNVVGFLSDASGSTQLWEVKISGGTPVQVSSIEGGINSFEYAPSGNKLYYLKDVKIGESTADLYPDLPLANIKIITDLMYRHWNHWEDYAYSHIFVTDFTDGKLNEGKDILEGEPYDTPLSSSFDDAEISWSPDGSFIAYTCKKMNGTKYAVSTNSDLYLYNLNTGITRNITEGMPGYDKCPVFSNDSKKIAFQSMATAGYESDIDRLCIYDIASGEKIFLTKNFDQSVASVRWDNNDENLIFISGTQATFQLYTLSLETGKIRQITKGDHNYTQFALAGNSLIGGKMTMSMATELFRVDLQSGSETQLSFVNAKIYDHIQMGKVEKHWVETTDHMKMLTWVIYPPDFDPQKSYPALLYCQGGPQSAVSQFFSFRWNFQMMAANGYIIVAPNRRGVPTFGSEWLKEISGDYGGQNMKDYLSAIDALKVEPYIDENRLGAVGASYGGFSIYWLAGHHEKRFKCFISHCGIFNLESMYAETEETFFVNHDMGGAYWEKDNKVAQNSYANSPHNFVGKWDTPIMMITGGYDFRIPYTESMQAFNAARLRGVPAKLLFFPDESHFVQKPQNSILWQREFFSWLDKYLKKD